MTNFKPGIITGPQLSKFAIFLECKKLPEFVYNIVYKYYVDTTSRVLSILQQVNSTN